MNISPIEITSEEITPPLHQSSDPAGVRFSGEDKFVVEFLESPLFQDLQLNDSTNRDVIPADRVRRQLLSNHILLSQTMAPDVFNYANKAAKSLSIDRPIEIYQAAGSENAANWHCHDTVFISLRGEMISQLDSNTFTALFGHEFGHHLCHTNAFTDGKKCAAADIASSIAIDPSLPEEIRLAASRISMAKEFTADRYAALATGDLDGPLRLLMSIVTGLPATRLTEDTDSYLAQADALFSEKSMDKTTARLSSHPEHLLRAYALNLFCKTNEFHSAIASDKGTLTLASVDETLESLLTVTPSPQQQEDHEPVPPEIHEFALCCAVLIAAADGKIDESELKCLEETFAEILPEWRDLINEEKALDRFTELLPLAFSGGEKLAASIFHLLFHIMAADGEIHLCELEMISKIGASLDQEYLFDALLAGAAHTVREAQSERTIETPLPALPPAKRETEAALNALFNGLSRRGSGQISLARSLRMLGQSTWSASAQSALVRHASKHQLELETEPTPDAEGNYNNRFLLKFHINEKERALRSQTPESISPLANARNRDSLKTALQLLRERLVSGDGRSPSVRLYRIAKSRHIDLANIDRIVAGRSERLITQILDSNKLSLLSGDEAASQKIAQDYARSLLDLEREYKSRREETGAEDFYIGYPFIIGRIDKFFVRAPLVLHPFSLVRDGEGTGSFSLTRRSDEIAIANQALLRLLFSKKGFDFTDELAATLDEKAAEGIEALLAELRSTGLDIAPPSGIVRPMESMTAAAASLLPEGIQAAPHAIVGFFPQSSSDLIHDYDDLLAAVDSSDTDSLSDELNSAVALLPSELRADFSTGKDHLATDRPVIYADPSQRAVVQRSRSSRLLVMDGPPGTGKSQTIVNLIADALDRGTHVAVVCEKRVALDVVKQRLDTAGLGHLAAIVHDVNADRKELCTRIADRLEEDLSSPPASPDILEALRKEAANLETELAQRSHLLATSACPGFSLSRMHSLAAAISLPRPQSPELHSLDATQLEKLLLKLEHLYRFTDLFLTNSPLADQPETKLRPRISNHSQAQLDQIENVLEAAHASRVSYENSYSSLPLDPTALDNTAEFLNSLTTKPPRPEWLGPFLHLRTHSSSETAEIEKYFTTIDRNIESVEKIPDRLLRDKPLDEQDHQELTLAIGEARQRCGSFFKFLQPAWHRANKTINHHLSIYWTEKLGSKITPTLLTDIENRNHAADVWHAADAIFSSLKLSSSLPKSPKELTEIHVNLHSAWQTSHSIRQQQDNLEILKLWPVSKSKDTTQAPSHWIKWLDSLSSATELHQFQLDYYKAIKDAAKHFPSIYLWDTDGLKSLTQAFTMNRSRLQNSDNHLEQAEEIYPHTAELIRSLATTHPTSATLADWTDALRAAWAESHIAHLHKQEPKLTQLDRELAYNTPEETSERLLELHQRIATSEASRIASANDQRELLQVAPAAYRARRTPQQSAKENLIRECRKQRRVTPLRTLVRRHASDGILDVLPVWLMSPETTAILFPRKPIFELLIIDEASQCTVENGLPVLTRAKRTVIAGDDKQMPPTSFFKSSAGITITDNSDSDNENLLENDAVEVSADRFESESLLSLARQDADLAPLRWHYRARFEELIAFSNHSMYGGTLLTIPSTASRKADPALKWIHVDDGVWDSGINKPEAIRVVDILAAKLAQSNPPTVGIITFNLSQRRTILDEIDLRRGQDEDFARDYDSAASAELLDERPFVKNLESVQGDERDCIIFSLGYAPVTRVRKDGVEEKYVPARFGPLGRKGGERRLNVAVSRAKEEITVVSSFDPSLLSVAHTKNDGPRLFKAFIEFTRHLSEGNRAQAEKILNLVNDQSVQRARTHHQQEDPTADWHLPLATQISQALEKLGYQVETHIGSSEFSLPVALVTPNDPTKYSLAILCDEPTAETPIDAYEKYVHIPNVLCHRGWHSHLRVSARDWHLKKENILSRIESAIS